MNMRNVMGRGRVALGVGVTLVLAGCSGQAPDASKALSRQRIESGGVVPAEELRVAEYLAYYDQHLPEPTTGQVGLDLRLGNPRVSERGGPAWLQVGLQARSDEQVGVAPLNLALVIDRSGSMADDGKMDVLKQALTSFLTRLAPNDRVALVAYSNEAEVVSAAREVGDGRWVDETVAGLAPSGGTNLHAGLMAGLKAVDRQFDARRNNLVILLTDGIANAGETDPDRIAAAAKSFNDRGIHLVTIGLGHDLNDTLLSQLAHQGEGAYHFVDRPEEIERVFRTGVSGLIQRAASDVAVTLAPAPGVRIVSLTGYNGRPPSGPVTVRLKDMGTGDSQVLLAELLLDPRRPGTTSLIEATANYTDLIAGRAETIHATAMADVASGGAQDPLWDTEVLRNVTIQRSAEGLKQIDQLYRGGQYEAAWNLAHDLETQLREVARLTGEDQMVEDADLMRRYQETLGGWFQQSPGRDPGYSWGRDAGDPPSRGRLPTPDVPVLDTR